MYECLYIYMHVIYACIYDCVYDCIHVCMHACNACMHVCIYACFDVCVFVCNVCMYVCMYVYPSSGSAGSVCSCGTSVTLTDFDGVPYDPDHVHLRVDEVVTFQLPSQTKIQIRNWCVEDLAEVFDRDGSRQNTYADIKPHK